MQFDPTPDSVKLFRANAIGFGISILAMFGAIWWWMVKTAPMIAAEPFFVGFFAAMGLVTAAFYFLPAMVPRRMWGYIIGWIQIGLSLTSGTGTLPTIAVLIAWIRDETKQWFDRKPIDGRLNDPAALRAKMIAIVGYYAVISAIPFAVVAIVPTPGADTSEMTEAISTDVHVTSDGASINTDTLRGPEVVTARHLVNGQSWSLSEQTTPTAVTVWASYCGACEYQMSAIADRGTPGRTTQHVTLALDCDKKGDEVRQKLADSDIESPALCAVDGIDVGSLPTTIFYDSDGRRRATLEGYQSAETLDRVALAVEALQ